MSRNVNKRLYRAELYLLKILPMLIALVYLADTVLSFFDVDTIVFSMVGGTSILVLVFLYVSSYVFQFCEYHRMPLHYIVVNDLVSLVDYEFGLPCSNFEYLCMHLVVAGIFIFLTVYLKVKCK